MTPTSRIPPRQQLIRSDRWPVVGERQPARRAGSWMLTIGGLVERAQTWSLEELGQFEWADHTIDIHCVTRWSKLDMVFTGLPLAQLLAIAIPTAGAEFVSFGARSERCHSSSMRLQDAIEAGAILVVAAQGAPLPEIHGGPLRLVVPGRYFYKSVKWLERIELCAEDRLGFWESTAGYHNEADPWREQRYLAPAISKQEAARLIARRDFSGRDLRGMSCAHRDLTGLVARDSQLRDADFRDARLTNAQFQRANLSNAHFDRADLRGADFSAADVEGASFVDADLRGANFCVATLFGASLGTVSSDGTIERPARFDATTRWNLDTLSALTDEQLHFLRQRGVG